MAETSMERQAQLRAAINLLSTVTDGDLDDIPEVDDYHWDTDGEHGYMNVSMRTAEVFR